MAKMNCADCGKPLTDLHDGFLWCPACDVSIYFPWTDEEKKEYDKITACNHEWCEEEMRGFDKSRFFCSKCHIEFGFLDN